MSLFKDAIQRGTRASQPLATDVIEGTIYYVTDENVTERSNASAWQDITDGGSYSDEKAQDAVGTILTDSSEVDFTYSDATPSITAAIVAASIANSKLANEAADTFKGRAHGAGTGVPQNLTADQASTILDTAADPFVRTSAASAGYTDENAQDAVGGILTDTATIDFTYDDAGASITASVKAASITEAMQVLADNTTNDATSTKHGYVLKTPGDATKFLNGAATAAFAQVKDSDLSTSDITTNNASTTKHGFAPKLPNDATKYYDGTGAFTTPAGGGNVDNSTVCGRLTLETAVAVSTTDQTAKSTLYFTPYHGNQIALYTGAAWVLTTFAEISLALSGLTSGKNYDVFIDYNSGTPQVVLSTVWTNDTTRADAIALQDGVPVKSGTTTYRLVGTIRTTNTTTTEDSAAKRFVWNMYNQRPRQLKNTTETTASWTYTTATFRQARASATNQFEWVTGSVETQIAATVMGALNVSTVHTSAIGVGIDSTSTNSGLMGGGNVFNDVSSIGQMWASYSGSPGLGYHYAVWLEYSQASGTTTWYGQTSTVIQTGMLGTILN